MKNCRLKNQQFLLKCITEGKTQGTLFSPRSERQEKSGSHGLPGPRLSSKNCRDPVLSRKAYDWQIFRALMWTTLLKTSGGTVLKLTSLSVQPCSTVNSENSHRREEKNHYFEIYQSHLFLTRTCPQGKLVFFFSMNYSWFTTCASFSCTAKCLVIPYIHGSQCFSGLLYPSTLYILLIVESLILKLKSLSNF